MPAGAHRASGNSGRNSIDEPIGVADIHEESAIRAGEGGLNACYATWNAPITPHKRQSV
jgi:hypothetical protein